MAEKRYIVDVDEAIIDTKTNREYTTWDISGVEDICDKLNNLTEENEELKTIRSDLICELDIVQNELNIAIDKGFAPSTSYKNYMASKKTEYDKFWENKIKTHNNTLKELKE